MADTSQQSASSGYGRMRFEATLHLVDAEVDPGAMLVRISDLDLDRVPDPEGRIRVLVNPDECARLLDQGFEVRLQRAVPVRALDPKLIADDDAVRAWFETRIAGLHGNEAT